ncbi:MAG: CHC2 zinc finger domain-containing protein, partial [Chloroflexota bacterium]|nr:CHC2 zinc finger domain-containing protein [Chloroflexota bacterium]
MSLLDDVKARLNIVDVVSNYVPLTQAGRVFKARCPFHTERTPSFVVNPERGSWRCFGACAEGGDAIRFVMKMENQTFSEALRALAVRLGVPLPTPRQQAQMDPLLRANQEAMRFFQRRLQSDEGAGALAYLQDRGVAPETAEA